MTKEKRAIKIRLYPNNKQLELMNKSFGADRWIYNKALALKKQRYEEYGENLSWIEISKMVTFWKKTEELKWLNEPSRSVFESSLRKLDTAYKNFFKGQSGFPRFKKRNGHNSFVLTDPSRLIGDTHIKLPKLGTVKIKGLRNFEGQIKDVTISKNPSGQIFATFSIEDVQKEIKKNSKEQSKTVGIDVNLENFLTDSNRCRVENPKFKNSLINKLKFYQRKLSKAVKGSRNRRMWQLKIAKLYQRINNLKQDFLHKLSNSYVKNHDIIIIEKLQIKNMLKNHKLAESISNVSWSEFFRQLKYKSIWHGCTLIEVSPNNTSRICSNCSFKNEKLTLKNREWTCLNCGKFHIRDENASKNIKNKGKSIVLKDRGDTGVSRVDEFVNCLGVDSVMLSTH